MIKIQEALPEVARGRRSRVVLDVASFGGFLFEKDALTMPFAPKDEHEAQVQFALERGIPAISTVMGTKRLPFPGNVFDVIHCARCRVPWHNEGGTLLLEPGVEPPPAPSSSRRRRAGRRRSRARPEATKDPTVIIGVSKVGVYM
jgi:hypothetical protein